jgi:transcriptional regulator with XRE-family HTH domain
MFDIVKIGMNISKYRRALNMTQMELADRLNISYQAVSNWECGKSMPDIAKLTELAVIFGVSVDELLNNKRAAAIVDQLTTEGGVPDLSKDELAEVAPVLKPDQVDQVASGIIGMTASDIASVAPFLSQEFIDDFARNRFSQEKKLDQVIPIAPFLSEALLEELARQILEDESDLTSIVGILPFMNQAFIDEKARKVLARTSDLTAIACMAPFISEEILNQLAVEALEKRGLSALSPIMPFIDARIVEDYIRMHLPGGK